MASITTDKRGNRRLQFVDGNGIRQTVRLGKLDAKAAQTIRTHAEALLSAKLSGSSPARASALWASELGEKLHDRLARVGLVEPRTPPESNTLHELVERFIDSTTVAPTTTMAYRQTANSLIEYFGDDHGVRTITAEDASLWRRALAEAGYAKATQAKRVYVAKLIFKRALSWGLVDANPFADLKPGSQSNPDRTYYVTVEDVDKIIDACPDARWRAIVGLCRFAGLRCPSELVGLTWADVDLVERRLVVRSPKTAHHEGHAVRLVPIAPRLAPLLEDLYELAHADEPQLFPTLRGPSNLRTTMHKIIARAGLTPWPRLFQNMRASCATDWASEFPNHDAASWLGHSPMIAAQHYLKPRDEHFRKAAGLGGGAQSDARVAQKATQSIAADSGTEPKRTPQTLGVADFLPQDAEGCNGSHSGLVGGRGLEPRTLRV